MRILALISIFMVSLTIKPTLKGQDIEPQQYVCYPTYNEIVIDGMVNDPDWSKTEWTDLFQDIEGNKKPAPLFKTRAKLLWDEQYLYVYAELEEPDVWANITQRDAVIFHDNDFEVFIDPDGDTHGYFEFEMNALNTVWDLLLPKPYRDGGPAINDWNYSALKSAVQVKGTLNNPSDRDKGWSVEIAFPLKDFQIYSATGMPRDGDTWRINFSRVEWKVKVENGKYVKEKDPATGKPFPEYNWVWSPIGAIDMHRPESWGFLQFSAKRAGEKKVSFKADPEEAVKTELRKIYFAQRAYWNKSKKFAENIEKLGLNPGEFQYHPQIQATWSLFEGIAYGDESPWLWHIDQSGRTWKSKRD